LTYGFSYLTDVFSYLIGALSFLTKTTFSGFVYLSFESKAFLILDDLSFFSKTGF